MLEKLKALIERHKFKLMNFARFTLKVAYVAALSSLIFKLIVGQLIAILLVG